MVSNDITMDITSVMIAIRGHISFQSPDITR